VSPERQRWEAEFTPEARRWLSTLGAEQKRRVAGAVEALERGGPGLRRPVVGTIRGSRHHNMKELRLGSTRILFAFDHGRRPVVLIGGDKRGNWKGWYKEYVPRAERAFDEYRRSTGRGDESWRASSRPGGGRSGGRSR
jgi:hypothetical protein